MDMTILQHIQVEQMPMPWVRSLSESAQSTTRAFVSPDDECQCDNAIMYMPTQLVAAGAVVQ